MWKKLLSLLKGTKEEYKEDNVQEPEEKEVEKGSQVDLNPMTSKLYEDEYAFLSFVQGELKQGHLLVSQGKFAEAREVLKPLITMVKGSIVANYESEQYEKLLDIVEGSTILADTYVKEGNYSSAYEILGDTRQYAEHLTRLASDMKETLMLIVHMYCMYIKCCHVLGKNADKEAILKEIESVIAILSSCVSRCSVSDKIIIIERICDYNDELVGIKAYKDACAIYSQVILFLKWEELDSYSLKHSYAILYGRYVVCLLNSNPDDINSCKDLCLTEIEMYQNLLDEKDSVQAKMDLAVAYSHLGTCCSLSKDYPNFVVSHLRKIGLLTVAIKDNIPNEDRIYDNKKLSESVTLSIKNCINVLGGVNSGNANYYKELFDTIKDINQYYLENSEMLAYINLIAIELFKFIKGEDFKTAQDCLVARLTSLLYLLNNYGPEKDIVKDFADTVVLAQPFVVDNEKNINDNLRELWIESYNKAKEIFHL